MEGTAPKGAPERSEIQAGVPHLGWGRCYVVDKEPSSKLVTLFCPFTFEGFQVSRNSFEYCSLRRTAHPYNEEWHARNFEVKWAEAVRQRWQRDFDTAVVVMQLLGLPVPEMQLPEGMEHKVSGGKEADVLGLLKPIKRKSRTGQVLAFFWPGPPKPIRVVMAELAVTRSNVLSQLYLLTKNHGIGYELKGETAHIMLPPGCEDPYAP